MPTAGQAPQRPFPPRAARTPTQHLSLGRLTGLTVLLATGLALLLNSCADRRTTNASIQCEVTVSTQLFRSDQAKIDREVIRRVSCDMWAGREIIWRDAYFQGWRSPVRRCCAWTGLWGGWRSGSWNGTAADDQHCPPADPPSLAHMTGSPGMLNRAPPAWTGRKFSHAYATAGESWCMLPSRLPGTGHEARHPCGRHGQPAVPGRPRAAHRPPHRPTPG